MDLYASNILDHNKNPRFKGNLAKENLSISRREANHSCGDILELDLEINGENIKNLAFRGDGCAISQSAMSILLCEAKDMTLQEILELTKEDVYEMLGVPISARRSKCASLSLLTLKNSVLEYKKEATLGFVDILHEE